ncbi:hypothetical protein GCM10009663_75840 [Kitasatospora arboriphila]|uniref:Bacterial Ig-like domain-containing protein n=1 Tax=Kitasatospora arboriphila TaxID=258052 RepID=A0ABN1U7M8_9ACTN
MTFLGSDRDVHRHPPPTRSWAPFPWRPTGTHVITAAYSGDPVYRDSRTALTLTALPR